jgi:hypothetical protein
MRTAIIVSTIAALAWACGPRVDDEARPPGELELEYEDSRGRLYRLDRRVEVIYDYEREDGLQEKCGFLTDRAYDELESTLAALDPSVDYGEHPADCTPGEALVYVDGFEHSPFECRLGCCRSGLTWAALVYHMVLVTFDGIVPTIGIVNVEGEPYIAIEPDQPCS